MMLQFRFRRLATLAIAASLAAFLLPGLVAAHSELVTAEPAEGAVVPSPFTGPIVLTFSEHLADGSKADLVGPSGSKIAAAKVDATAKTMTFTLTAPLDPGTYQVQWVSIADDGDLLRQPVVTFTVAPAATPSAPPSLSPTAAPDPSASPSVAASVAPSAPAASAGPTPVPSGSGTAGGSGDKIVPMTPKGSDDGILPTIVALIVLGAGAFYLLSRRNRPIDRT